MLTRLPFRRDVRLLTRCFSDKSSDTEGTSSESLPEKKDASEKKTKSLSNTEKIQSLLKEMMLETKVKASEYQERFAVVPEVPKKRIQQPDEIEVKTERIEDSITEAAGQVAQAIGGDVKQTEAELLSKVLGKINQTSTSLSDLILGMKVDRSKAVEDGPQVETRGQQVKRHMTVGQERYKQRKEQTRSQTSPKWEREHRSSPQLTQINIFEEQPLGIFKKRPTNYGTTLDVWDALKQRELMLATAQPPSNYFEKMATWTKQGKVWKFPINNEQGLEEEAKVHFSEHIFLDTHLEGWCPTKGPVRHFMELVCVGLSKNPFYTVQEKRDHIMWYKEYFESKKDVLTEIGAWEFRKENKPESSA